jgi:hypothetical protein
MPHPALSPQQQFVACMATKGLTQRHRLCYKDVVLLIRGRIPDAIRSVERGAAPARGFANRCRAALGIILFGMTTEARGAFAGLGQERTDNARLDQVPGSMAWS